MKRLFKILTLGGFFGFVVGLLFAPQKGDETRKKVSDWLNQGREKESETQFSEGKED